ncbi:zinc finger protein 239-like protein [Platysternon megacephalum]|uniref:Zinc finger protein 239-like protein n=1 Tax=Platysternon megacephalum TaxID=55544 RepID=A0A4D9DW49_9SAUR|nr:zinc finger protein 239-like protein [Platysternon megacephalum]
MSQEGFSSLLSPDGPVLGAVGAYDWSGGIYLYGSSGKPSFINVSRTSTDMNDAYFGYSSQVITANGQSSYVVGAPRYQHTGKVVLFSRDTKGGEWTPRSEVLGEQIGSYFGGTLCAVDLDRDGNTDLVLIGAPMYYTPLNGGRVSICLINWPGMTLICTKTLQGQTGQAFGRFGASMSEIGDISGDGRMDVAIGAPMENNNRGALYIFHGEKGGLSAQYRQRIEGSLFPSRLPYFGQAISGGTDLTGDGLPDIAVGAQGQVLLLRSRPVLRVRVSISFQPPTIPTSAFNCQTQEQLSTEASRAEVCFTVTKSTTDSLGDRISSTIQYSLALDPGRTKIRAAFDSTGPVLSRELRLGIEKRCETHQIMLPLCPEDTVTPITLRLKYTLTGEPIAATSRLRAILSEDSAPVSAGSLPFQKDCGTDGRCDDQLEISFNFSGLSTLVVGVTPELNTTVSIQNRGENSYSTTVQFFYPAALSYRRVLLLQPTCVFQAVFVATCDVSSEADLGDRLQSTAKASSDNGGPITQHMMHQAELPVKYGIFIILTSLEESTKYVNFSSKEAGTSVPVTHRYEVKNLRQRSVPVSVTFQFPVELSGVRVWDASEVVPSKPQLAQCDSEAETPGSKDFVKQMSERPLLDCSVATCYSSQVITANGQSNYVVGAPRYQHTGKVVLFSRDTKSGQWTPRSELLGEQVRQVPVEEGGSDEIEEVTYLPLQIGSCFRGTLCAVDLDRDGNTDLILIGAPTHHTPLNGGCVYNYPSNWLVGNAGQQELQEIASEPTRKHIFWVDNFDTLECIETQLQDKIIIVEGYSSQVITANGQSIYMVGAPLCQDTGKVILFSRDTKGGEWTPGSELLGEQIGSYFGSILCAVDLDRDGNMDLVLIGAPMYHTPLNGGRVYICPINLPGTTMICTKTLHGQTGEVSGRFGASMSEIGDISGDGQTDVAIGAPMENDSHGALYIFHGEKGGLSPQYRQGPNVFLSPQLCPKDILTPITLHFNYTLTGEPIAAASGLRPILSEDSVPVSAGSLPFQKDCGTDGRCDDQLAVSFNFSGLSTLVVGVTPELNTTVSIQNRGENSYSTTSNRRAMAIKCSSAEGSEEQSQRNSICHINHPIFWSGAEVVFVATFDVSSEADLGDRLQITANASSDNGGLITETMIHQEKLLVKHELFIILTSLEESTKYVSFSAKEAGTSVPVTHGYKVKNLRQRSVPVSVTFQFPVELSGVRVWDASEVVPSKPELVQCNSEVETPSSKDFVKQMSDRPLLDCSVATCKKIRCRVASLEKQQPLEFMIKGNISFQWVSQLSALAESKGCCGSQQQEIPSLPHAKAPALA